MKTGVSFSVTRGPAHDKGAGLSFKKAARNGKFLKFVVSVVKFDVAAKDVYHTLQSLSRNETVASRIVYFDEIT